VKFFACALDTAGVGIGSDLRRQMQSMAMGRGLTYRWDTFDGAAVLTGWDEFDGEVSIEQYRDWLAVGQARLDNRADLERHARAHRSGSEAESDLALILRLVADHGANVVPTLLGDFGFITWRAATRTAIGACDAFNMGRLYYTQHRGRTLIGSRAEPLSMMPRYDVAYLSDLLTDSAWRNLTVYAGVKQLAAASTLSVHDDQVLTSSYWSPAECAAAGVATITERDAIETCRDLLTTSIRLRLDPRGRTWAQLSGGIDSSAVVSVVQWLAEQGTIPHGLDGTLTFVIGSDTAADERRFSDAVVKRWGVRNEVVVDAPMWFDDIEATTLPLPDQPLLTLPLAPIDGRFRAILRNARARVLLTGWASDQLFTGSLTYLADHLARGHVAQVFGELAHRAALGRRSFWSLAHRNVVKPFLPGSATEPMASWFRRDAIQRAGCRRRPDPYSGGRIGRKYAHWLISGIVEAQYADETRALAEMVSVRHPFLYRPLVEFALRLPPELCSRPLAMKWILRQAMQGILPDAVRTRISKGGGGDSLARMFIHQRPFLDQLARDPILADLGLIDARRFTSAVAECANPHAQSGSLQGDVFKTLAIEAWLQVRSGRWPHGFAMPQAPVVPRQESYQLTVTQRRSV
jgi:asparagine synthase (glutamine-hydrolysing)